MSSYHRLICSLFLCSSVYLQADNLTNTTKEDVFTLVGLDRELNSDFTSSAIIYEKLYEETNSSDYLKKSLESYYSNKDYEKVITLTKKYLTSATDMKEYLMYKYVLANMILKKYDEALVVARELETLNIPENSGLIGDLYYIRGDYEQALKNYQIGYERLKTPNLILAIANLFYTKFNNKQQAIKYLKDYIQQNDCDKTVCIKLLEYHQNENNLDGMIEVMELLYTKNKSEHIGESLAQFEMMLAQLYMQKDKQKGIDFLVETGHNNLFVASLYEQEKRYDKALALLNTTYQKTADDFILGRIAMIEFTIAKDKKIVINGVLQKFESALKVKSNPEYENFYGYLLIDYDLDVKKGLDLVKKAYDSDPQNIAFEDSVAWGYFKNNQCQLAEEYIKEVVKKVGLEDEEIKLHYDEIKDCIEGKKEGK